MPGPANLTERPVRMVASKVPEVTVLFWSIKVLTTGMGETASDYLTHRFDPVVTAGVGGRRVLDRVGPAVLGSSLRDLDLLVRRGDGQRVRCTSGIPYAVSSRFRADPGRPPGADEPVIRGRSP